MKKRLIVAMIVSTMAIAGITGCRQQPPVSTAQASVEQAAQPEAGASETVQDSGGKEEGDAKLDQALSELDANRGEGKTIGVVAFFQANDWNRNALAAIEEHFTPAGYKVNIIDGNGDPAAMNAAIDTHIANGVDGIIICGGDGTALQSGAKKIVESGIPYSCIDMFQEGSVTNTMADNWGGGTQLGLWALNRMDGVGKVLILDTPSWVTLKARADSADIVFDPFRSEDPKTGIATERFDIDAGNAVADAQTKVSAALAADTDKDIKVIITSWDLPAVGAYAALKDSGREDIVIASGDTGTGVMQAMRESTAPDWVFMGQKSSVLGTRAAKGLDLALNGKQDVVPFAQFGPTYFVANTAEAFGTVTDGSEIKLQSPEEHWKDVFGTDFGVQ